jgi:hypothetical protein
MAREVTKRAFENILAAQRDDPLEGVHLKGGVLHQGIQQV